MNPEGENHKDKAGSTPPKSWHEKIFDALDSLVPKDELPDSCDVENQPEWVNRVMLELCQQVSPAVRLRTLKCSTPKGLGLHLGQQWANAFVIAEKVAAGLNNDVSAEQMEKRSLEVLQVLDANKDKPGVSSLIQVMSVLGQGLVTMAEQWPKFEEILHRAFRDALEQGSYEEVVEFFGGFASGLAKKGILHSRAARATTSTSIYNQMFMHWQEIEALESITEFRKFLIKQGIKEQLIGDQKRLEKLCERVGKSFRGRGRPRKKGNSDTTPS